MAPKKVFSTIVITVLFIAGFYAGLNMYGCGSSGTENAAGDDSNESNDDASGNSSGSDSSSLSVASTAFDDGGPLPDNSTCTTVGGNDVFPAISWSGTPAGMRSLALTVIDITTDPDTVHMVLFNIPSSTTSVEDIASFEAGNFAPSYRGNYTFDGPCPPPEDSAHTYEFTVYALGIDDLTAEVSDTGDVNSVIAAIEANDLDSDAISGTFENDGGDDGGPGTPTTCTEDGICQRGVFFMDYNDECVACINAGGDITACILPYCDFEPNVPEACQADVEAACSSE